MTFVTMKLWRPTLLLALIGSGGFHRSMCAQVSDWQSAKSIYEFNATDIDGNAVSLEKYRGNVCIIVNVASK
ncbi:gpx4 [Pungitius sinensis]